MLKIKELRKKKGLSQIELSAVIDTKQSTLSAYETGYREPNIEMLTKIAIVLGVTVDELISFKSSYEKLHKELNDRLHEIKKDHD